jgi:glyoxylase I family protein
MDRSIRFYTETLGMKLTGRRALPNGVVIAMVSAGGTAEIEIIHNPNREWPPSGGSDVIGLRHVAFWVKDVDGVVAELKGRGVEFYREPAPKGSPVRVAFFRDPDNTAVELMERT